MPLTWEAQVCLYLSERLLFIDDKSINWGIFPDIKLYIAINSFEALEAFRYFYDDCVIYNAETSKVIKCLDSYEAYKKEILSPIMKAFGKDLAFFKNFYNKRD